MDFLKIITSMRGTLIVVAIGLLALAGGLLLVKIKPTTMFALDGFYFGIASACYWWRSGQVSYERQGAPVRESCQTMLRSLNQLNVSDPSAHEHRDSLRLLRCRAGL
jgi:hypothetical protein